MSTKAITIVDFEPQYAPDFLNICMDWFDSDYFKARFTVEEIDRQVISDPGKHIIAPGGHIFFARMDGKTVGTVALIKGGQNSFELSKMHLMEGYRGLSISDALMQAAIAYSQAQGKEKLWLESIRVLKPALALFKKYGFEEVPLDPHSHYARADIKMELILA